MKLVVFGGALFFLGFLAPSAHAQASCAFDSTTRIVTVSVSGATTLEATSGGMIQVDGVDCAAVSDADSIQVSGGATADSVTVVGSFAPAATPESEGVSEVEIDFALGGGSDTVTFSGTRFADDFFFFENGLDHGSDGDMDFMTAGVEKVRVLGNGGNDQINAQYYTGGGRLYLYGQAGADLMYGSDAADSLYGGAGDDEIHAGGGNDYVSDGTGNDVLYGDDGNDRFDQGTATGAPGADSDWMVGGAGRDLADYGHRSVSVSLTLNGNNDDGESGEGDTLSLDIESLMGGSANDTLMGSSANNHLTGGDGDDFLTGSGGRDTLEGGAGNDALYGETGNDVLYGDSGIDWLVGGDGADLIDGGDDDDTLFGDAGVDSYLGGAGNDVINNSIDGVAETVDCGAGIDDADFSGEDTLVDCEY